MDQNALKRSPGAPSSVVPALAGFTFLSVVAPAFYVLFLLTIYANRNGTASDDQFESMMSAWITGGLAWIIVTVWLVIYPATRGKIWALKILRVLAVAGIMALFCAIIGDFVFWKASPGNRGFAIFLFWLPLAPLMVCAGLLIEGLLHQPWFDPNATPGEIGPSRGTVGDYNRQAGMDAAGRLSPEKLAAALAAPAPPPRWLCYAAPPIAAARMKGWWHVVISAPLCVAALALVAFLPIRAIFVYALMGTFADRLRSVATYRKTIAAAQAAAGPESSRPRATRKR